MRQAPDVGPRGQHLAATRSSASKSAGKREQMSQGRSDAGSRQGAPPGLFPIHYSRTPQIMYDLKMPQISAHPTKAVPVPPSKSFSQIESRHEPGDAILQDFQHSLHPEQHMNIVAEPPAMPHHRSLAGEERMPALQHGYSERLNHPGNATF